MEIFNRRDYQAKVPVIAAALRFGSDRAKDEAMHELLSMAATADQSGRERQSSIECLEVAA